MMIKFMKAILAKISLYDLTKKLFPWANYKFTGKVKD